MRYHASPRSSFVGCLSIPTQRELHAVRCETRTVAGDPVYLPKRLETDRQAHANVMEKAVLQLCSQDLGRNFSPKDIEISYKQHIQKQNGSASVIFSIFCSSNKSLAPFKCRSELVSSKKKTFFIYWSKIFCDSSTIRNQEWLVFKLFHCTGNYIFYLLHSEWEPSADQMHERVIF